MALALVWALTAARPVPDLPVPDKKAPLSTEVIAPMFDGRAVRARAPTPTGAMWSPQAQKAAQQEAEAASGGSPRSGGRWDGKRGLNPSRDARNDASAAGERLFEETLPNGCSYLEPNCKGADPKMTALQPAVAPDSECPKCGHNANGVPNCCSTGGAWENQCTSSHDEPGMHSQFSEHTWDEGFKACSHLPSKGHAPGDVSPLKRASQQAGSQAAGVSGATKEAEALRDIKKPFIDPIPLVDGEQARKCDSEREEWCDGYLTPNEMLAAGGSALKPGGNPKGCIAKQDILGKRGTDDEWCQTSCSMLVPNCPPRLCVCDDSYIPEDEVDVKAEPASKPVSAFAKAFDSSFKNMEKWRKAGKARKDVIAAEQRQKQQRPAETDAELNRRMRKQLDAIIKSGRQPTATELVVGVDAANAGAIGGADARESGEAVARLPPPPPPPPPVPPPPPPPPPEKIVQGQNLIDLPKDENADCPAWADMGECTKNPAWMATGCPVSCAGKLPAVDRVGVANEVHDLMVRKAEHDALLLNGGAKQDLGEGSPWDQDDQGDRRARSKGGGEHPVVKGIIKAEYSDSSGLPEGADPSTCVKVSQVSTEWCRNNCASKPPVCPANLCSCSVRDAASEHQAKLDLANACGPELGIRCGQTYFDGATRNTIKYASDVDQTVHKAATGTLGTYDSSVTPEAAAKHAAAAAAAASAAAMAAASAAAAAAASAV